MHQRRRIQQPRPSPGHAAVPLRRRRKRQLSTSWSCRLAVYLAASSLLVVVFILGHTTTHSTSSTLEHYELYQQVYRGQWPPVPEFLPELSLEYHSGIDCPLTVVFVDSRLADEFAANKDASTWLALESVAQNAADACVALLTILPHNQSPHTVYQAIVARSLPLFRNMIAQGRVRVGFLDSTKYQLASSAGLDVNALFMNRQFWSDEFTLVDSDLVLVVQADAVLCRPLPLETLRDFAHVGALWPPTASQLVPFPEEGMCRAMPARWRSWLLPQLRWQHAIEQGRATKAPKPQHLLETDLDMCHDGVGPVGNGGLSLRSRAWMMAAIEACPHVQWSGMPTNVVDRSPCRVVDPVNEDLYFGVVLRGLGAPLPLAQQAAAFAVETLFVEDALDLYGSNASSSKAESELPQVSYNGRVFTVPVGFHKPYWYLPNDLLQRMSDACPFLPLIYHPEDSRWQPEQQQHRTGRIGS